MSSTAHAKKGTFSQTKSFGKVAVLTARLSQTQSVVALFDVCTALVERWTCKYGT